MSCQPEIYGSEYNKAIQLLQKCGEVIKEAFYSKKKYEEKSCSIDLVTATDQKVEEILVHELKETFPNHRFIGEESVSSGEKCCLTDDPTWIIDPIDGTLNFVHCFPHSSISLGFYVNQEPVMGFIFNPVKNEMFEAVKNNGAYFNGKKISVSNCESMSQALLMWENGTSRDPEKMENVHENFVKITSLVHGTRALGSCALNMSMVACGAADVYFEIGIHCWDIAAGRLIVEEAGGVCIDPSGGPLDLMSRRMLVAATPELAQELARTIVQYYPPRD